MLRRRTGKHQGMTLDVLLTAVGALGSVVAALPSRVVASTIAHGLTASPGRVLFRKAAPAPAQAADRASSSR